MAKDAQNIHFREAISIKEDEVEKKTERSIGLLLLASQIMEKEDPHQKIPTRKSSVRVALTRRDNVDNKVPAVG